MRVIILSFRIRETREDSEEEGRPERKEDYEDVKQRLNDLLDKFEAEEHAGSGMESRAQEEQEHPDSRESEFEEVLLEVYEKFGIGGEVVRNLWNEDRIKDVEDEIEALKDREQVESEKEKRDQNRTASESAETVRDHLVVDLGGGLVCLVETGGREQSSLENVEASEKDQSSSSEVHEVEETAEGGEEHSETEEQSAGTPVKGESVRSDAREITAAATNHAKETSESRESEDAERRSNTSSESVTEGLEESEDVSTGESKETRPSTRITQRQSTRECEECFSPGLVECTSDSLPEAIAPEQEQLTDEEHSDPSEGEGPSEALSSSTETEEVEDDRAEAQAGYIENSRKQELIEVESDLEHQEPQFDTHEHPQSETEIDREDAWLEELTTGEGDECTEDQESAVVSGTEMQHLEAHVSEDGEDHDEESAEPERVIASIFPEDGPVLKPMLPDEIHLGLFPETEAEQVRHRLKELFDSLTDEQKEEVRRLIRVEVESVEELDELVARFPDCQYNPDFKAMYKDAAESVQAQHAAASEGSRTAPRLIQGLRNREAERRWAEIVFSGTRDGDSPAKHEVTSQSGQSRQEVSEKTPRYRAPRGKQRPVNLCRPVVMGKTIRSMDQLEKLITKHHPGLKERKDFDVLMKDARVFFELVDALKGRTAVRQHEIDEISEKLHMSRNTARDRVFYGQTPLVFRILEERMSIGEAKALVRKFKLKLRGITCWEDVQQRLDKMYPGREYEQIPGFAERKKAALGFFRLMEMLKGGGSTKEIARRANIRVRVARSWTSGAMRGEIPWLVRHVLPMSSSSGNRRMRHLHKVKMRFPVIRGKEIRSLEQLRELIERRFPAFRERADYEKLMHTAEQYFIVKEEYSGRAFFRADELPVLEKRTRRSTETVSQWLIGKAFPMIFDMLANALAIQEAETVVRRLAGKLNGVTSFHLMTKRLGTLYTVEAVKSLPSYAEDMKRAKGFFRLIVALAKGGLSTDIGQRSGLAAKDLKKWLLEYSRPRLVSLAAQVPSKKPRNGFRWLPMKILPGELLKDFIQVPVKIRDPEDLYSVLKQLKPVTSPQMTEWRRRFGNMDRRTAFMYALGSIISDGGFRRRIGTSFPVFISLSAGYAWSERFGEAFSYCLGKNGMVCGFASEHKKPAGPSQLLWMSTSSPFFIWVMKALLGLGKESKTNSQIHAEWVLMLPKKLRVAFIQGWADGDGYASIRSLTAGISSKMNKDLLRRLLSSLGIVSSIVTNGVVIFQTESIGQASRLPLFRNAIDRMGRLQEIVLMIGSMRWRPVTEDERRIILQWKREKYTCGEISALLWVEFGIARRWSTINGVIKREARTGK